MLSCGSSDISEMMFGKRQEKDTSGTKANLKIHIKFQICSTDSRTLLRGAENTVLIPHSKKLPPKFLYFFIHLHFSRNENT